MRQSQLLKTLESVKFSGQLIQTAATGHRWIFYLSQGLIIYATGGAHPVRRWRRNVSLYCPQKAVHRATWYFDLGKIPPEQLTLGWEYALLNLWLSQQDITAEQMDRLIRATLVEQMLDIERIEDIGEEIRQDASLSSRVGTVRPEGAIAEAQLRWQSYQSAQLTPYDLNQAPIIRQPDRLQRSSPALYQNLSKLLNGQHPLYDLAAQLKRNVIDVTASLLPCIELGWIELTTVPDFPVPMLRRDIPKAPTPVAPKGAVIACIDDSQVVRQMMEELLTSAGYQFVGIHDPLRAIGILLARKPDLIFLDLMMPNANGHEVCQQLRKISSFSKTPIVILTGSDGFANRLRSNFAGASDFLAKPLDAEAVLSVIRKHLERGAANPSIADMPTVNPSSALGRPGQR